MVRRLRSSSTSRMRADMRRASATALPRAVVGAKSMSGRDLTLRWGPPLEGACLSPSGIPDRLPGLLALSGRLEAVLLQPIVERGARQPQDLRGLRDDATGRAEDGLDVAALHLLQGDERDVGARRVGGGGGDEVAGLEEGVPGEQRRPLEGVAELPH